MSIRKLFQIRYSILKKFPTMGTFVQKLNPITGTSDWVVQNEDYDFHQEVARSAFADMLHDTERNQKYEQALKRAIDKKHLQGHKANVLDIGTGTGLLSMMAVRNGADSVTACEAFKPMSECAKQIIAQNGYSDKIKIIPKRSNDITVGKDGDMEEKCNILVTEVFDTELIGEGALYTYDHAVKYLLENDAIVVPDSAIIYAQVVECPLAQNWNKLKDVFDNEGKLLLKVPEAVKNCAGSPAVHDIQLTQFPQTAFNTIISPTAILQFDWWRPPPINGNRRTELRVRAERDGKAQAVFMWWELQMDTDHEILLSCAPVWAHPQVKLKQNEEIPWRDHWMQAVYYLPQEVDVRKNQEINLYMYHDPYSLWFNVVPDTVADVGCTKCPVCDCGLHMSFSRTRVGQMNDSKRIKKYLALFEEHLDKDSCVLVLGDGFYSALAAAKLGVKQMYFLETNMVSRRILLDFIECNNLKNIEVVPSLEKLKETDLKDVNVVLGEPYFTSSILPWDNLQFLYMFKEIRSLITCDVQIFPKRVVIKAVAVHFKDLYKIRSPLGTCEGFKMDAFDRLIENSSDISDDNVEAQPLWEYPAVALSEVQELLSINLVQPLEKEVCNGALSLQSNLECNGIVLWTDWYLTDSTKSIVTTGPISSVVIGEKIDWDMYTRQGVTLFPGKSTAQINYTLDVDLDQGTISFKCN